MLSTVLIYANFRYTEYQHVSSKNVCSLFQVIKFKRILPILGCFPLEISYHPSPAFSFFKSKKSLREGLVSPYYLIIQFAVIVTDLKNSQSFKNITVNQDYSELQCLPLFLFKVSHVADVVIRSGIWFLVWTFTGSTALSSFHHEFHLKW